LGGGGESKYLKLNLGCGPDIRLGYLNVDWKAKADQKVNLSEFPWPWDSDSADEVLMIGVLEHLPDTLGTLNEIRRTLRTGGKFIGSVPFCFSESAFIEPDHCRYFHPRSFYRLAEIFSFQVDYARLAVLSEKPLYRLRNLIPFRCILRHFLENMYDNIEFSMTKI
jgi:SAM-dependent methyltransferase